LKKIYFVLPCYNEEAVLNETANRLSAKVYNLIEKNIINSDSKIIFIDDGSTDNTWNVILSLRSSNNIFGGIKLAKNRGHQNALIAGLITLKDEADAVISMDADLQDDIETIDEMISRFMEGYDIVYAVRNSRKTDSFFKRITARVYYKFMKLMGVDLVYDHADYRLMSGKTLSDLAGYKEVNLFLRGIIPLLGYKTCKIFYNREKRFAGKSKYPVDKMVSFAVQGITSFSIKPIRFITFLGFFIFFISIIMLAYSLIRNYLNQTVPGWSSMIMSIWSIGGLQLLSIGIIGEYIGKIYLETKQRPRYSIETILI